MILLRNWIFLAATVCAAGAAFADSIGSVSLSGDSFVSPDYNLTERRTFNYFSAAFRNSNDLAESAMNLDLRAQISPESPSMNFLNISELNFRFNPFSVGRKKMAWSQIDEIWAMGLFQPAFRWNSLLPEEQGLTGLFAELSSKDASLPHGVVLFASFLFIPDQNASYELVNGKFQSVNPWFKAPAHAVNFGALNTSGQIYYDVKIPDVNKVLFNTSYAAHAYLGDRKDGYSAQAAFAYKPSNQLAIGAFAEPASSQPAVLFTIKPQVFMHSLLSADVGYNSTQFGWGLSAVHEKPHESHFEAHYTYKIFSDSTLISPYVRAKLGSVETRLSALVVQGLRETIHNNQIEQAGAALPMRFPFERAWKVDVSSRVLNKLQLKGSFLDGFDDEFSMVHLSGTWEVRPRWNVFSSLNLVRADESASAKKTIFYGFQNNDTYSLGVSYVF